MTQHTSRDQFRVDHSHGISPTTGRKGIIMLFLFSVFAFYSKLRGNIYEYYLRDDNIIIC